MAVARGRGNGRAEVVTMAVDRQQLHRGNVWAERFLEVFGGFCRFGEVFGGFWRFLDVWTSLCLFSCIIFYLDKPLLAQTNANIREQAGACQNQC